MYIRLFIHFVFFFSDAASAIKLSFGEFHEIFAILLLQRRLHDIVSIVLTVCAKALSTAAELVRFRYEKKVYLVPYQFFYNSYKIFFNSEKRFNILIMPNSKRFWQYNSKNEIISAIYQMNNILFFRNRLFVHYTVGHHQHHILMRPLSFQHY